MNLTDTLKNNLYKHNVGSCSGGRGVHYVSESWLRTCREPMEHKDLSWVLWSVVMDSDLFQVTVAQSNQLGDE